MMKNLDDYLAPMFVKELRQGLRSRVFVSAFLLTQLIMIVSVAYSLILIQEIGNPQNAHYFFWTVISFPLLLVLPVRGFALLSEEVKANTLELVFLTRLTAWRIVFGKWLCLLFQSFLLCTAILPYLVLRYYMGGINILDDLRHLLVLFGFSSLFSSITMGVSCYNQNSKVPKWILNGFFRFGIFVIGFYLFIFSFSSYGMRKLFRTFMISPSVFIGYGIFIAMLFLVFGASRIAPPAENYAAKKRIFGFILLIYYVLFSLVGIHQNILEKLTITLFSLLWLDAILEDTKTYPSIYRPFVKRGFWGRCFGRLFYPGWSTGLLYTFITLGLQGILMHGLAKTNRDEIWEFGIPLLGTLLLPLAIIKLIWPDKPSISKIYWIFQLSIFILVGFLHASSSIVQTPAIGFLVFLPHYQLFHHGTPPFPASSLTLSLYLPIIASVIILSWRMRRTFSVIHEIEHKVASDLNP